MADGIQGRDYLIAGIGGAVEGFFNSQSRENAEAKAQAQLERQAQLLMMKEERAASREMRKQKDDQTFQLKKTEAEYGFKRDEATKKRAQELVDTETKNEFELEKLKKEQEFKSGEAKTKFGYDKELETLKETKKSTDRTQKARTELRKEFEKAKKDANKDPFAEKQADLQFDVWAETTYPELFAEAYPDGAPTATGTRAPAGSKFGSIFQKVTGAASRTKQGANDSVEEPAPLPGTVDELPSLPGVGTNKRTDPEMLRADGSEKGKGFLGQLPHASGKTSTEISIGVNIGGKETEIPALVPTLTKQEVQLLLSGKEPTKEIIQKAVDHAKKRMAEGKNVFANPNDGDY